MQVVKIRDKKLPERRESSTGLVWQGEENKFLKKMPRGIRGTAKENILR